MRNIFKYLSYMIIVLLLSVNIYLQAKPQADKPENVEIEQRVKTLEERFNGLQYEMDDVKNVQGYIVWEKDWRNKENK